MAELHFDYALGFQFPPFWLNRHVHTMEANAEGMSSMTIAAKGSSAEKFQSTNDHLNELFQTSLAIKWEQESEYWSFTTIDPIMSVSGKNIIIRRRVIKQGDDAIRRGTIKETWSQDDYEINIAGTLSSSTSEFPEDNVRKLRAYCEARKPLMVKCALFNVFSIDKIIIEDFNFPFTKGVENQQYIIKAYSDNDYDLLVRKEDIVL